MEKLMKIREALREQDLDALIITNPINRRYMTNFTGTAGVVVIGTEQAVFITDFRYIEQANKQVKGYKIIEHEKGLPQEVSVQLKEMKAQRIGFEQNDMTYLTYQQYKDVIQGEFIPTSHLVENLRIIKSETEIHIMKQAAEIADKAFEHILNYIKPGVKEIDIANKLEFYMRKLGATSSSFAMIVASGYRSALPHGVASEKEIQAGELVTLDFGALYQGYCSDITRTVAVGKISDQLTEVYETVLEAQLLGVKGIKAGLSGKEADAITRNYISAKGYGQYFGHSTGHGLGMEVHEAPALSYRSDTILEQGMVVTVEPGIYLPNIGGCRIEDDIVITKNGNERLTMSAKELIIL